MKEVLRPLAWIILGIAIGAGVAFKYLQRPVGVDPWMYEQALREREIALIFSQRAIEVADSLHKETLKQSETIDILAKEIKDIKSKPLPEKEYSVKELEKLFEEWYYRDVTEYEEF